MKVLVAGDFVPSQRVKNEIDLGNYSCLESVSDMIFSSDYSIINFESPVVTENAMPEIKTGPNLSCSLNAIKCLKSSGFGCITLANNHFRDYGQIGVTETISACEIYDIDYVGGGKNISDAQKILYKVINGKTLAIINVCEEEWSIASESRGGSAPLNPIKNFYDILDAKKRADFVLVIVHGGVELYQNPTPRMQEVYRFFIDAGADAVVNHHQHCYCGYEVYNERPIFYGLGNFCFDKGQTNGSIWNEGYMVLIDFEKFSFDIIPYNQCSIESKVRLLNHDELLSFNKKIHELNDIITNPIRLKREFCQYVESVSIAHIQELEPIYNRYLRKLQRMKVIPRFFKGRIMRDWFDRLNCDSHREFLLTLLQLELEKYRD